MKSIIFSIAYKTFRRFQTFVRLALLLLLISNYTFSQSLSLFDIDTSSFPIIKAKFYAFDKDGNQITNLSASDFELNENGVKRNITQVSCPAPKPAIPISSVLTIDVSGSMSNGGLNIAKSAANVWINTIALKKSECAITSFDDFNYLNQDFTKDKNLLLNAVYSLSPQQGTDYEYGLLNPIAGSLQISKNGKHKKVVIFLTDGQPNHEPNVNTIVTEANNQNCIIYSVVLGMQCPQSLKDISTQTGGLWFENIRTEEDAKNVYKQILFIAQSTAPCTIEWESGISCYAEITNVELMITSLAVVASGKYQKPDRAIAKLVFEPISLKYQNPPIGVKIDSIVRIKAVNADFNITNITTSQPEYSISPTNFSLKNGESRDLTVSITALDSGYKFCKFDVENDICPAQFYASGGWKKVKPKKNTLKLIHPNGGEVFVVGNDTVITWEGVSALDTVNLEFSIDNGITWKKITDKALGLRYIWNKIPKPASNDCLVRVSQGQNIEVPYIQWQKTLGGSGRDDANFIIESSDGAYSVVGYTLSNDEDVLGNHGFADYWVVKLDNIANKQWQKCLGGSNYDVANSIIESRVGGFVLAGEAYSNDADVSENHGNGDFWVIKLDDNGIIQWQKCFGGSNFDVANSIIEISDSGFVVAGSTYSNDGDVSENHGYRDYWIVKLDNIGNIKWQKCFGGKNDDDAYSIIESRDSGLVVAGSTSSNDGDVSGNHGGDDCWVIKLDNTGNIQWQKCFGGTYYDRVYSITESKDGGFVVAGTTSSNDGDVSGNHGNRDFWVIKLDNAGNIKWQKCLGGSSDDYARTIKECIDGTYVVAGTTSSNDGDVNGNHGKNDYWIVKLDNIGNIKWQKCLGGSMNDYANSIIECNDEGYVVAGYSKSNDGDVSGNHGDYDFWVVKLSPDGVLLQLDSSDNVFSIVEPLITSKDIDMKEVLVDEVKDSVVTDFISNNGLWKISLDSIYFRGTDSSAFGLVSGFPKYEVSPSDSHYGEFRFIPSRVGKHNAQIVIITQSDTLIKNIIGEGVQPDLSIINQIIDFGKINLGEYKDTLNAVTIMNVGTSSLLIKDTKHNKPNDKDFTTIAGGGSFTLAPGDTCRMDLRFTPKYTGRTNGTLEFYYDGVGSPAVVQLYGESWTCIDNIQASIPSDAQELSFDSVNILDLKCKTILLKNLTDEDLIFDSIYLYNNYEFSIPQSQLPLSILSYDSALLKVCFSPLLLGLISDTIIVINNCGVKRIPLQGYCQSNLYLGESKCNTNIELETNRLTRIIVLPPSPNPFSERTSIIYSISNSGTVNFDFYNVYGEKINTITKYHNNSGTYHFEYTPNSDVHSGLYYCIVRMNENVLLFKIIYMK